MGLTLNPPTLLHNLCFGEWFSGSTFAPVGKIDSLWSRWLGYVVSLRCHWYPIGSEGRLKQRKTTHERAVFLNMLVHGCNRKFSHSVVILASSSPRHHAGEFSLPTTIPWCSSWIFLTMSDSAPSIRALLGPIVEVNRRLDSLLDIQWRLMELRNSLETFHPDMSELLHQSTVGIQRTCCAPSSRRCSWYFYRLFSTTFRTSVNGPLLIVTSELGHLQTIPDVLGTFDLSVWMVQLVHKLGCASKWVSPWTHPRYFTTCVLGSGSVDRLLHQSEK